MLLSSFSDGLERRCGARRKSKLELERVEKNRKRNMRKRASGRKNEDRGTRTKSTSFLIFLEIVERAYANKNHGGFIDSLRSRTGQSLYQSRNISSYCVTSCLTLNPNPNPIPYTMYLLSGAPNVNFRKISVWKTI